MQRAPSLAQFQISRVPERSEIKAMRAPSGEYSAPIWKAAAAFTFTGGRGGARITVVAPLTRAHAAGTQVSGSGITLAAPLTRAHASGAQVAAEVPTPGAPNKYYGKPAVLVRQ